MIKSVGDWIDNQIMSNTKLVTQSYNMFTHRVAIKNNNIANIMADDVIEICKQINAQSLAKAKKDANGNPIWNELSPKRDPIITLINSKFQNRFNEGGWNYWFQTHYKAKLKGAVLSSEWSPKKGFQQGTNYWVKSSNKQLTVVFTQGMVDIKNIRISEGPDKGNPYNILLACVRRMYGVLLKDIKDLVIAKAKATNETVDSTGLSKIDSSWLLVRGHGKTVRAGAEKSKSQSRDETGKADATPTTTAMLKTVAAMGKLAVEVADQKKSGSIADQVLGASMEKVMDAYIDVLEAQYSLKKFVKSRDDLTFNEDLIIEMEIISRGAPGGIVAQDAMKQFDAAWLKKNLREEAIKVIKKNLPKAVQAFLKISGSPSKQEIFTKQHQRIVIEQLFKHLKSQGGKSGKGGVDLRLKVNKAILAELKKSKIKKGSSNKLTNSLTRNKLKKSTIQKAAVAYKSKKSTKAYKARGKGKVAESPIALRNILNESLPKVVASKMSSPALQFRTGRFANSARVDMVHAGTRGGVGIDYTYMKEPYQTFEPGYKQGSTQRDPRKIIGESIRELAIGILGRQPHTIRRV